MTEIPAAPEVARRLADALEGAQVPYAIGGAIAYGLHAPPRATNDVDLNVFTPLEKIDRVFDALEDGGATIDRASARLSASERGDFVARVHGMRVDVFVPSIPLSASAASRVRQGVLLGRPIAILSAEDLVLFRLLFFRAKDLSDVERLVRFQEEGLEREYIRRWLVELVGGDDARVEAWDRLVSRAAAAGCSGSPLSSGSAKE